MKRFIRAAAAVLLLISLLAVPALAFTPYTGGNRSCTAMRWVMAR